MGQSTATQENAIYFYLHKKWGGLEFQFNFIISCHVCKSSSSKKSEVKTGNQ